MRLAVEDPNGIAIEPIAAVFAQFGAMAAKMFVQCVAPCLPGGRIAKRVQLENRTAADPKLLEQLVREQQKLDIGLRLARTEDLGIELMELAEAALLRALVAKGGAVRRNLERGMLLPAFGQVGASDPSRKFRPKRNRVPASVVKGIHLLGDHVGGLAQ